MEYLDKAGLAYLWSKIKAKLTAKADNDKYIIKTFTMIRKNDSASRLSDIKGSIALTSTSGYSPFTELLPTGYHIACILALDAIYIDEDNHENDISEYCHIGIITIPKYVDVLSQKYAVYLSDVASMSLGETLYFTLLLEKD